MNKHLVSNEDEYILLFKDFELQDAEEFLGVEFAFEDGSYPDNTTDESQNASTTIYRKLTDQNFPKSYPCIVLLCHEKDFDRTGPSEFQFLEFVYLEDFYPES